MTQSQEKVRRASYRTLGKLGLLTALTLPLAGCNPDDLLRARDIDVATEENISDPSALPAVFAGAVGDFQIAFSGHPSGGFDEGIALLGGLLADEYDHGGTFPTRIEVDQRGVTRENGTAQLTFRKLHRARISAERAVDNFAVVEPTDPRKAEMSNLAGYTYIFFGENYCSGVPFSSQPVGGGTTVYGPPTSTTDIFSLAIQRFDEALAHSTATAEQLAFARLGKARALLNLNQISEAAALAAQVPSSFTYILEHSDNTSRQNNGFWGALNNVKRYRVADRQGGNGLPYRSSDDPRIPWFENGPAFDNTLVAFSQGKYPERGSDVQVTTGFEARLIEAEAALREGAAGVGSFVTIHNALRATVPELAPLSLADVAAMTQEQRIDLHFQERGFWLWQTAHRLGDLRRLIRQYNRTEDAVFPTGPYFKGDVYADDVNLPIPIDEDNNPNFVGCIDRNA